MSKAIYRGSAIPEGVWADARSQWFRLAAKRAFYILAGLIVVPLVIRLARTKEFNRFGEGHCEYNRLIYEAANPMGWWFHALPPAWRNGNWWQRFLWLFSNDEDGLYGDRRGYWSDRCYGEEKSFANKYKWAALRNPANNLSRYTEDFACYPNQCQIEYWGDYESPDDSPVKTGWHFVKAKDKVTGRVYYGFRQVEREGGKVYNRSFGFKLKPSHADEVQAPDDAHKGFTYRTQKV